MPLWIKLTEQMIAVARKTYQASQTRSQEAVSDATGDLSDACAACHQAYRETRGRGQNPDPTDPSNKAARCLSRSTPLGKWLSFRTLPPRLGVLSHDPT